MWISPCTVHNRFCVLVHESCISCDVVELQSGQCYMYVIVIVFNCILIIQLAFHILQLAFFNHIWTCCDVYSFNNGWLRGEVRSPQPMPYLHAGGHRDSRPFWARDFLVLERSGLLSQTGHRGSQVFLLPAATPVRHCPTGKCRSSNGNIGGHHPQR